MLALLELQRAFALGLRDEARDVDTWADGDGIPAAARLRVYRNNARSVFERALEATFPVVRARVGSDYFRQLAHFYRRTHPSTVGDLHEVGRHFAGFLSVHLADGSYEWLAELAALEWAIAEAGVAADSSVTTASALAGLAPESVASVRFRFVPSLQCFSARVPVVTVWRANQPGAGGAAIDLHAGAEFALVHRAPEGIQLRELRGSEFAFIGALAGGATLDSAVEASDMPPERLPELLLMMFTGGIVADVIPPGPASVP